jgi:hypothetical protein
MRQFRVYFRKNGIKLTKLVYAESLLDIFKMFEEVDIILIQEIDAPEPDISEVYLN